MSVHSLPREDELSSDYTYLAGPKMKVVLMGATQKSFRRLSGIHSGQNWQPEYHHHHLEEARCVEQEEILVELQGERH